MTDSIEPAAVCTGTPPRSPDARTAETTRRAPMRRYSVFWLTFWLAAVLVLCKACHRPFPEGLSIKDFTIYAADLAMLSAADVAYAIVVGLFAQFVLWLTPSRRLPYMIVWSMLVFYFTLSVMYAVSSVKVFDYLRTPMTYALFYLGGDFKNMKSSVGAFCTPGFIYVIASSPFFYLAAVWLTMHQPARKQWLVRSLRALLKVTALELALAWLACAAALIITLPSATIYKHLVRPFPSPLKYLPQPVALRAPQYPAYLHKTDMLALWAGMAWIAVPVLGAALFYLAVHFLRRRNAAASTASLASPPPPVQPDLPPLPVLRERAGVRALSAPTEAAQPRVCPCYTLTWRFAQILFISAILIFAFVVQGELRGVWGAQHRGNAHVNFRAADNPHHALIASTIRELLFKPSVRLDEPYPPEFLDEFKPVGQRGPGAARPTGKAPHGPKNVIIIIGESLGAQHMAIYGDKFPTTPNLLREQSNSLVFDNVYSHITNTSNAMVALVLGVYPPVTWREWTVERPDFPGTSLAQILKQRGYSTAFITGGSNDWSNQGNFLKNRGFDEIRDYRDAATQYPEFSWGVPDKSFMDMLLKYIDSRKPGQNFCVVSWTQGTHHPYFAGPDHKEIDFLTPDDRKHFGNMWWDLHNYLNAVHALDEQLGRLFDELRKRGLAEDTLVMVTGDHGEAFGVPHEQYGHSGHVYQEDVRVPFIMWNPTLFKGRERNQTIGAHIDLNPTVLDMLGIDSPSTWQGRSLFAENRPPRAYFYGAHGAFIYGVRNQSWKYIYDYENDIGYQELYDLANDPDEQTNLADQHPDLAKEFRQHIAAWLDYERDQPK